MAFLQKAVWATIVLLTVLVIGLLMSGAFGKEESFGIKDRCGPIMNL